MDKWLNDIVLLNDIFRFCLFVFTDVIFLMMLLLLLPVLPPAICYCLFLLLLLLLLFLDSATAVDNVPLVIVYV